MKSKHSNVSNGSWTMLELGETVELTVDGEGSFQGVVEVMTENGEIVWLVDPLGQRRMFHVEEACIAPTM